MSKSQLKDKKVLISKPTFQDSELIEAYTDQLFYRIIELCGDFIPDKILRQSFYVPYVYEIAKKYKKIFKLEQKDVKKDKQTSHIDFKNDKKTKQFKQHIQTDIQKAINDKGDKQSMLEQSFSFFKDTINKWFITNPKYLATNNDQQLMFLIIDEHFNSFMHKELEEFKKKQLDRLRHKGRLEKFKKVHLGMINSKQSGFSIPDEQFNSFMYDKLKDFEEFKKQLDCLRHKGRLEKVNDNMPLCNKITEEIPKAPTHKIPKELTCKKIPPKVPRYKDDTNISYNKKISHNISYRAKSAKYNRKVKVIFSKVNKIKYLKNPNYSFDITNK